MPRWAIELPGFRPLRLLGNTRLPAITKQYLPCRMSSLPKCGLRIRRRGSSVRAALRFDRQGSKADAAERLGAVAPRLASAVEAEARTARLSELFSDDFQHKWRHHDGTGIIC